MIIWNINFVRAMLEGYIDQESDSKTEYNNLQKFSSNFNNNDRSSFIIEKPIQNENIISSLLDKKANHDESQDSAIFGDLEAIPDSSLKKINIENNEDGGTKSIEKQRLKIDISRMKQMLKSELVDLSPEVHDKIATSIESSKVDRNKFRDFFLIKKRIITDGNKKIVTFDIKERIIPKISERLIPNDRNIKILLGIIMVLLFWLVFMTTLKTYENVLKHRVFNLKTSKI